MKTNIIFGVDEVGRGSLIGPVITCCVSINNTNTTNTNTTNTNLKELINTNNINDYEYLLNSLPPCKITDSKKMTRQQRQLIVNWVKSQNNINYTIGSANIQEIDELNIRNANNIAMNRAIYNHINDYYPENKSKTNINCYIDGNYFNSEYDYTKDYTNISINFETIVKGDSKSLAIAIASIIAKEYRDELIINLTTTNTTTNTNIYLPYKWDKNMGYGTKDHRKAILIHGVTIYHRLSFINKIINHS